MCFTDGPVLKLPRDSPAGNAGVPAMPVQANLLHQQTELMRESIRHQQAISLKEIYRSTIRM